MMMLPEDDVYAWMTLILSLCSRALIVAIDSLAALLLSTQ